MNDLNIGKISKRNTWKFATIFFIINLGFILVLSKIFYIQVIDVDFYRKKAKFQHETKVNLKANRGNILDRNGKIIATSIQSVSLAIDPTIITEDADRIDICNAVSLVTNIDKNLLKEKIDKSNSSFVWLARGLTPDKISLLDSIKDRGFIKIYEPKRQYLYGNIAYQVIGTTDIDNKGNNGIELAWDSVMHGKSGFMIMNRDASGRLRPSMNLPKSTANDGNDIVLTLDIELQKICENELKSGCQKVQSESGTVIAMDPKTGEILAFANYNQSKNDSNLFHSLRIRGITDQYEPGSTFKLITASAALEENIIKLQDIVDGGDGKMNIGDFTITDDHPIGKVTFKESFAKSSNIVFAKLAEKIPNNILYKYIRDFGFGLPLGIDIPGEANGSILKPENLNPTMKMFVGHGYGITVTPLQILSAFATVANNGELMKPFLVKTIINNEDVKTNLIKPQKIRQVLSNETCELLKEMLVDVVENGTGQLAKIDGLKIAGKTGTAQQLINGSYQQKSYVASFAGFFPADKPKIAMIVILNKPIGDYYGGSTAAPIFKNIANSWISVNSKYTSESIKSKDNDNLIIPDFKGFDVQSTRKILNNLNIRTNLDENSKGIVLNHNPQKFTKVNINDLINIDYKYYDLKSPKQKNYYNLIGLSLRSALALLNSEGIKFKINGNGRVYNHQYQKIGKETYCIIECR